MKNIFCMRSRIFLVLAGFFAIIWPAMAFAQSSGSNQGLTISPFLLERKMEKGQSTDELIDITNTSDRVLPVEITINDFVPVGENGQQQFLPAGDGDARFSLSKWVHITGSPKPQLAPGEKTSIAFTITPPANAEDGGHYGAILFGFQGGQAEGTAVAVAQKIGAIILVKLGKVNEEGQVAKFSTERGFYEYPPVTFVTRFNNTGNVHVKPRGSISITNMFGRKIASVQVNENANNVLAQSERQFKSAWSDTFAFGRYAAEVKLVYGDSGQVASAKTVFWVIPWKVSLVAAVVIFLILLLLITGIRRYNRWILKQANKQRNKK